MAQTPSHLIPEAAAVTLDGLFRERVKRTPDLIAYRTYNDEHSNWREYTWAQIDRQVARRWLGEHAEVAARLEGLRGYVVYIATDACASFDGIAVTTFDSREAAERAFADPDLAHDLRRTREEFAESVEVCFVDEHIVVGS